MAEQIQAHLPCSDCGSSDALAVYDWGTKCYSCGTVTTFKERKMETKAVSPTDLVYSSVADRGLTKDTCQHYGIGVKNDNFMFPYYDEQGNLVAYKKRNTKEKKFSVEGAWKDAMLFGQQLFNKGGKYVTITEGEFDAAAAYQAMGSKWPVVSVRNGADAAIKDIKANYEWLDSFENIVICFDNDEPGRKAANQCAEIFGTKAKIFKGSTDCKDACDYVSKGKSREFLDLWWKAEVYTPDGIVDGASLWEKVSKPVESASVFYPFNGINELTFGIRQGEMVTITAGSGLGKSQFLREIVYHTLLSTKDNIGLMFLEESIEKTAKSLMSLAANKPLHLPPKSILKRIMSSAVKTIFNLPNDEATQDELRAAFDITLGSGRIYLFDHFGSTTLDNIVNRVRYMAMAMDCKFIVIDHISIIVSAQDNGDERKAIDEIMTRLRMLVQETGISLFVVSHLKRPDKVGHEEGAAVSLAQLRGSGAIGQLSDIVIGLERNGQAVDLIDRHTTKVRILKNRFSGLTGPACSLLYDQVTGRMTERIEDKAL